MRSYLEAAWWMILLRSLALLLFGFFALVWPGLTLGALALGLAVYLIVSGTINIITTLAGIGRSPLWFLSLLLAAVEVAVGVYALKNLTMTAATLVLLVGLVLVVRGIVEIIAAYGDGYAQKHRSLLAVTGVLSLVAGVAIWIYPAAGALAWIWVLGLYAIVGGAIGISVALEARSGTLARA